MNPGRQANLARTVVALACVAIVCGCGDGTKPSQPNDTASSGDGGTDSDSSTGDDTCVHVDVVKDCQDRWCRIPAGCFIGGSPEDEPGHAMHNVLTEVTLTRGFLIGQYEVTQGEWEAAGFYNPSGFGPNGDATCAEPDCPVENVNWFEAVAYANRLSELHDPPLPACYELTGCEGDVGQGMECTGVSVNAPTVYDCEGYRLPTHAEWEYATRAGTTTAFYSGPFLEPFQDCPLDANVDAIAWYCANSGGVTHRVGQKTPNAWGLHDPSGNVREWVSDQDTSGFGGDPVVDPVGLFDNSSYMTERCLRGGGASGTALAVWCRSAARYFASWTSKSLSTGLRLAITAN